MVRKRQTRPQTEQRDAVVAVAARVSECKAACRECDYVATTHLTSQEMAREPLLPSTPPRLLSNASWSTRAWTVEASLPQAIYAFFLCFS